MSLIPRLLDFKEEFITLKADKDIYNKISETLNYLDNLRTSNESICNEECKNYIMFDFDSLAEYVNALTGITVHINKKAVSHRSKNKNTKCQNCGGDLTMSGTILVCTECGHEMSTSRNTNSISDNYKHIQKQLNALVGLKTVNKKVRLLEPYLKDWILHRYFLRDWLKYTNSMDKWINKYNKKNPSIDLTYFNTNDPAELEYDVIRLYISEFYKMITYCKSITKSNCNMLLLSPDEQIEVCEAYAEQYHGKDFRDVLIAGIFNYNNTMYELSTFLLLQALKNVGNNGEDDFVNYIADIIGIDLYIPGLNFPFEEVINISMKIPQVYTILQDFPYILNDVYKIPYVEINKKELDDIFKIIIDFNDYYKSRETKGRKYNSPMYHVVLRNVILLNKYKKYADIVRFIPKKGIMTTSKIDTVWIMYISEHPELMVNKVNCEP